MHIARYKKKKKTAPADTLAQTKHDTQQKRHSLMSPENNGTLKKWHKTNTPPKIDKYDDTHKKWCLTKMAHLTKKCPKGICQGLS